MIEKKYKKLDEITHCLERPGMYIGSIKMNSGDKWLYSTEEETFIKENITYNPGFLKLFDEIIMNSVDEHKRSPKKLTTIKVEVKEDYIAIWDNGGIPVVLHKEENMYVPELIFSNLRAGSNFNDDEQREVAGTNGVGSSLVNIFSKKFIISTCDGKKKFYQVYTDNMKKRKEASITESKTNHTEIKFYPDLERFSMDKIDDTHIRLLYKRTLDLAGVNTSIKFYFNGEKIDIKEFKQYAMMFPIENKEEVVSDKNNSWEVIVGVSKDGFQQVSFVNSVETYDGGTHVEYIINQIIVKLREYLKSKHKIDVKPSEIKNHIFLFVNSVIINPSFSSQTKEKLITEQKDFGSEFNINDKTISKLIKTEIIASILDWYSDKTKAKENEELRKLNKALSNKKIDKLIDAKSKDRSKCELMILEGQSAATGIRKYREPQVQGAFMLKGKFVNVRELSAKKVMENKEATDLMSAIGLRIGEKVNKENLRYHKIIILTDQDKDGDSICGLLINFLHKYWSELFDMGMVYRNETPLVVAKEKGKGKSKFLFYTSDEYIAWENKNSSKLKNYDIEYKKGLGALENEEYEEILKKPKLVKIIPDKESEKYLDIWFGLNSDLRKKELLK